MGPSLGLGWLKPLSKGREGLQVAAASASRAATRFAARSRRVWSQRIGDAIVVGHPPRPRGDGAERIPTVRWESRGATKRIGAYFRARQRFRITMGGQLAMKFAHVLEASTRSADWRGGERATLTATALASVVATVLALAVGRRYRVQVRRDDSRKRTVVEIEPTVEDTLTVERPSVASPEHGSEDRVSSSPARTRSGALARQAIEDRPS